MKRLRRILVICLFLGLGLALISSGLFECKKKVEEVAEVKPELEPVALEQPNPPEDLIPPNEPSLPDEPTSPRAHISGCVTDSDTGEPLNGVIIGVACRSGCGLVEDMRYKDATDERGHYAIDFPVEEIPYCFLCMLKIPEGDGYEDYVYPETQLVIDVTGGKVSQSQVERVETFEEKSKLFAQLDQFRELPSVDFTLKKGGRIEGKLVKANGSPKPGAYIQTNAPGMGTDFIYPTDRTDEDGSFRLTRVLPGLCRINADIFGYGDIDTTVMVEPGKVVKNIVLTVPTDDSTGIKGEIIDKDTGEPVPYVDIYLRTEDGKRGISFIRSDEQGLYRFRGLQPGAYLIHMIGPPWENRDIKVIVESDDIIKVKTALKRVSSRERGGIPPPLETDPGFDELYWPAQSGCAVNRQIEIESAFFEANLRFSLLPDELEGKIKSKMRVYCKPPFGNRCAADGIIDQNTGQVIYYPLAFSNKSPLQCGCLEGTTMHEWIHTAGGEYYDKENHAYTCAKMCINCAAYVQCRYAVAEGCSVSKYNIYENVIGKCDGDPCKECDVNTGRCKDIICPPPTSSISVYNCLVYETITYYRCASSCVPYDYTIVYPSPGCDNPDENEDDSGPLSRTIPNYDPASPIGVLLGPNLLNMFDLLDSFKEKATIVPPEEISPSLLDRVRLLIIPSGGLMGLSNSELFKQALAEYVALGGSVISMTQQVGDDFSILPGEPSGDGWTEDISCIYMSGHVCNNHQILAGQFTDKPWLHVDGRLYSFPPNATVILRRTRRGPGDMLISYPYGNGNVIASTLYSDYAFFLGGATAAEMALVRDMVSWARTPMLLPEAMLGEPVNYELQITNGEENTQLATTVVVDILDPNRSATQSTQTFPISLSPGESTSISISYQTEETSALGIWHTRYTLFNEEGEVIQPPLEEDTGRFAIVSPTIPDIAELEFFVDSDADEYVRGADATFTISIKNNTNIDRMVKVGCILLSEYYDFGFILIPGQQTVELPISANVTQSGTFAAYFRDTDYNIICRLYKYFLVYPPSVSVTINPDKQEYGRGEMVNLILELENRLNIGYGTIVNLIVSDPDNVTVYSTSLTLTLDPSQVITETISFPLALDAVVGNYNIKAEIYDSSGEKIDIALNYFKLPMFLLSVAPILPPVFSEQNYVEFEIINTGEQDIALANFYTSLTDPAQNIIWSGSQELTNIPAGESTLISFQIPVSQVLLGDYQLDYMLTYHEKVTTGKEIIQSRGTLGIVLDKASYKLNESVGVTVSLENLGCYVDPFTVVSRIPALNFSHTQEVLLDPGKKHVANLTALIPPDFSGNSLKADVVATLPSGDFLSKEIASNVLPLNPALSVTLDKESYRIREDLNLVISASEPGNFVGSLTPSLTTTIPDLNFDDTKLLTLVPGVSTSVSYSLTIPETVNPGNYGGAATITFPNGAEKTVDFAILIPQSKLKIHPLAQTDYSIGDTVSLTVENLGGVDTTFDYQIRLLSEGGEVVLLDETGNGSIGVDETITLSFNIPEQTAAGSSILNVQTTDHKTDKIGDYFTFLTINGLFATLEVYTGKEIYLKTENITGLAELANGSFDLSGGNLNLKVVNLKKAGDWTIPPMWIIDIYSVAVDKFRKEIWIGDHVGGGMGIGRFDGNYWWPYIVDCEIFTTVKGIAVDDLTGEVWFVTDGCGVYSFDGNDWSSYNTSNSDLASDFVWSIAIDASGDKWFGTWRGGVSRFDGINWTPYNTANSGLASDTVPSIAIDETTGEIWFATQYGASRLDGTNWTTYNTSNSGLTDDSIYAIAIDNQGNKWFGQSWAVSRFDGVDWVTYTSEDGLVDELPYSLATDPATGEVWVGHGFCGVSRFDGSDWSSMSVPLLYCLDPLVVVASIAVDWEGAVWFGVVGAGVARYKEEVIEEILWEEDHSIDLAAEGITTLTAPISTLGVTGKLYFMGTLTSELGQQIAQDKYPFYVIDEEIALTYAPDKQLYKVGDTVAISGEVWNFAGIVAAGLNLELSAGDQVIYNEVFEIPAGGSHPFSLTIPAATEGMVNLLGVVTQDESLLVTVRDRYEVAWPVVTAAVEAPEVVGEEVFEISVELENSSEVEADLVVSVESTIGSQTQELTLEAGKKVSLPFTEQVTQDTTFNIVISGDHQETITRDVLYGLAVIIDVEEEGFYPIGQITMPFTVTNIGLLAHDYEVIFELFDANNNLLATVTRSYYLQPFSSLFGSSAEDFLGFDLEEGDYRLSFSTLGFSGEINFSVLVPQATVALTSAPVYPEGVVSIPYLISNAGVVPGEFVVGLDLEAQGTTIESQELGVYLNPIGTPPEDLIGSEYEGELQYNLSEGEYLLTASGERLVSPVQIIFQVIRAEDAAMEAESGAKANGQQEVVVTLNNLGYYDFNGNLLLDTGFWSDERSISVVESTVEAFSITLAAASPGAQILNIYLYNTSGNIVAELEKTFEVNPPIFQVTQLPAYMTFPAGAVGDLSFSVSNLGDLAGQAELDFIVFDYEPDPGFAFIDPGQTGNFTFTFFIPEDLEERDYYGSYELKSVSEGKTSLIEEGLVKFYVEGVKVEVTATLDKEFYQLNDIAKLTLNITPAGELAEVSLDARVSYSNFEEVIPFTLSISGNTLSFDVPIDTFYPNKLLYEILFPSGRSIYINTLYIQQQHDDIWLYTDKDLYLPGDVVIATVEASTNGVASIFTSEVIGFTSTVSLSAYTPTEASFTLPQDLLGGTYIINYQLQAPESQLHTYKFDVHGLMAFFKQIELDKSRYEPEDTIHASFVLEANMDFTGYLDCFVIDPEGEGFANSTYTGDFNGGWNYFTTTGGFSTVSAGMFKFYCILYADEAREKMLTTGMENFDVGSITVASIWSDKYIYESCVDGAIVTIDLYGENTIGVLELYLDDNLVYQEDVALNGFSTLEVPLDQDQIKLLGVRELRASLFSNALVSTKVTSFFTRDTISPEISVTQVADGEVYSTDVTPVIVVTDCNLSNQVITLNGESFTSGTTVTTDAEYILSIIAGDLAGNYSITIVSFIIDQVVEDQPDIRVYPKSLSFTVVDAAESVVSLPSSFSQSNDEYEIELQSRKFTPEEGTIDLKLKGKKKKSFTPLCNFIGYRISGRKKN